MKKYPVHIAADAAQDLEQIQGYLMAQEGPVRAEYVMSRIEQVVAGLEMTPSRGAIPAELEALGHREFREVFFKPYRIFYWVAESSVEVMLVADGRRDMRSLLQRRLLQG